MTDIATSKPKITVDCLKDAQPSILNKTYKTETMSETFNDNKPKNDKPRWWTAPIEDYNYSIH